MDFGADPIARRAVLDFLANRDREVVSLTSQLVAAPSPNLPGDETAPGAVVRQALQHYGLPIATTLALEPHRPNLMVRIDGALPGPNLALCGHLDTKPVGEAASEWRTDPFAAVIEGDRLYGLGSTDMKGAVAAMILAAAAVNAVRERFAGSLTLLFTADEEYGSNFGARYMVESGALGGIDAIILGEPSGVVEDWDAIRIVSRGICCFTVTVSGTQTHSSISDWLPTVNAVEAMARVMVEFRQHFKPRYPAHPLCPTGPTINIGVKTLGGVGYGVLPGHAEFWTDVRLTPGMNRQDFIEDIELALAKCAPELQGARVHFALHETLGWFDASEIAADHPAVIAASRAAIEVLGVLPQLAAFPGATDAHPLQVSGGIPTLAAFGPGQLPLAHGPNEWVSVKSLGQAMRMYALTVLEFGAMSQGV